MLLQFTTISFVIVMLILFQLAPGELRKYVLLFGSVIYICIEGGISGIVSIVLITLIAWGTGLLFLPGIGAGDDQTKGKRAAIAVIVLFSATLFGWKYIPWLASQLGMDWFPGAASLAVPIGLSFYTFQAISYVADLYSGEIAPEKSLVRFAIYMTWFPKWMSGPIERAKSFLRQLDYSGNIRAYSFKRITTAAPYFVWGLVLKLMIADKVAIPVDAVFSDISAMGPVTLMLASLLYTIQIYCDFAGYTNIAIGISKLFGIDLIQNFRTPYMAENIIDFWRRWHISLSNFLRDYIYIPLGGNRKGTLRKHFNTLAVFLVCGMWHGAGLSFIVWGLIHALLSIIANIMKKTGLKFFLRGWPGRIITFISVSFAWIFFRAESLSQAVLFVRGMLPMVNSNPLLQGMALSEGLVLGLGRLDWWIAAISLLAMIVMDALSYEKDTVPPGYFIDKLSDNRRLVLLSVILSVVLVFGEYGAGDEIRKFVYMNF
jgi:D-alanyl-lipoteichoic acid acyltransferase DltB (MBOAT superfamily)